MKVDAFPHILPRKLFDRMFDHAGGEALHMSRLIFSGILDRHPRLRILTHHGGGIDCGFAQGAFHRRVHPSIMWAKLRTLAEGARIASGRLFPARATR